LPFEHYFQWLKDNRRQWPVNRKGVRFALPNNLAFPPTIRYISPAGLFRKENLDGLASGSEAAPEIEDSRAAKGSAGYGCVWTKEKKQTTT
jgi:hypothetical protein